MRVLIGLMIILLAWCGYVIHSQHQTIGELIELNHDKSVYIDTGCHERFEGSEEESK